MSGGAAELEHGVVRRLGPGDEAIAKVLFAAMAEAFEEEHAPLSDAYVTALLARADLWVLAAIAGDEVLGGLTAHHLPMTRAETSELFIYDLAVREAHRRRGVGRRLVEHLRALGAAAGVEAVFVPADDEDEHALDFYRAIGGAGAPVTIFTFS